MSGRPSWNLVLVRLLAAALFGGGVAHMLLISQGLPAGLPATVGVVTLIAALLYLLTRDAAVFLRTLLALVVIGVCVFAYDEKLPEKLEKNVYPFVVQMLLYFTGKQSLTPEIIAPSTLAIRALMGVVAGLFVVRFPSAAGLSFFAGSFFLLEWAQGRQQILGCLPATLMGIGITAAAPLIGEEGSPDKARVSLPLCALALAAACAVFTHTVMPDDTSSWRARPFEIVVDDINDALAPITHFTRPRHTFTIAGSGFSPLGDRLGGPVSLGTTPALMVRAPYPLHLRGAVSNVYTGERWLDSVDIRTYRMGGLLVGNRLDDVFDADKPFPAKEAFAEGLQESFAQPTELAILHESYSGATLFSAGRVSSVFFLDNRGEIVSFDENAELFVKDGAPTQSWYLVNADVFPATQPGFDDIALELETGARADTAEERTRMQVFYMGLPDDLPQSVRDAATKAVAGAATDYQKAMGIKNYVGLMSYTLTPDVPPAGADFVAHFLETGEGYCTYYASAVAVMARCVGLPSRYVEGYYLNPGSLRGDSFYHVGAADAHAWAEIYISGLGWLPFDATPMGAPVGPQEDRSTTTGDQTVLDDEPIEEDPLDDFLFDFALPAIEAPRIPVAVYAAAAGLVILSLMSLVIWLWKRHRRGFSPERMLRALDGDASAVITGYWRDAVDILAWFGSPIKPGETSNAFARRVDDDMGRSYSPVYLIASLYSRAAYGGKRPDSRELERASDVHATLMGELISSMGRMTYFFRRVLRGKR